MPVGAGHLAVGIHEHGVGRHDVHHGEADDGVRVIERKPMSGTAAAIMPDQVKAFEAERAHEIELVGRHRLEGVIRFVGEATRLGGIAIAAQIGADHRMVRGQRRGHASPHRLVLREAVHSRSGGPDPPMTQAISASPTLMVRCEKPSNIAQILPGDRTLLSVPA